MNSKTARKIESYWKSPKNQRDFFDKFAKLRNINQPSDWGKITYKEIVSNGGSSLLNYYGNSVRKALKGVFPDIKWDNFWFRNRIESKFWSKKQNQREFMENLAKTLEIKTPSEWGKITVAKIRNSGGTSIVHRYKGSLFRILTNVFPEVKWQKSWFKNIPLHKRGYWKDKRNQYLFIESLQKQFGIQKITDWEKVSTSQFIEHGGKVIIDHYGGSLLHAIDIIYSDSLQSVEEASQWSSLLIKKRNFSSLDIPIPSKSMKVNKEEKLEKYSNQPHHYWKDIQSHKYLLLSIAKKMEIKSPEDWISLSKQKVIELGGSSMLNYFQGSLKKAVQCSFPEMDIKFHKQWNIHDQRKFFENLTHKLSIKSAQEWGKVTVKEVKKEGGQRIINYYGGSILKALKSLYPDIQWQRRWFIHLPKYDRSFWNSSRNCRIFLDNFATEYGIEFPSDWKRVSIALLKQNGAQGLLKKYSNSLQQVLSSVYGHSLISSNCYISSNQYLFHSNIFPMLKSNKE